MYEENQLNNINNILNSRRKNVGKINDLENTIKELTLEKE
jgi:hypothetical protein